jgi:glycosyltransferase involved in cell wall biosynthesis
MIRKAKVLFDPQTFQLQNYGGISRYFVELQKALSMRADVTSKISLPFSNNEHLLSSGLSFGRPSFRGVRHVNRIAFEIGLLWCDIIHSTYYLPEFLRSAGGKRRVVTVYDMIPELFPDQFHSNPHLAKEFYCRKADLIVCISEQTRRDMLSIYGIDPDKSVTIHLGVEFRHARSNSHPRPDFGSPYVLFVGNRTGYKNFKVLLNAIRIVVEREKPFSLVVVGGGGWSDDEHQQLDRSGLRSRTFLVSASDVELRELYRNAACFVFPSLYEGFGLPILEAFSEGCPVVLSDTPVFREIAKDGAILFAGDDAEACADAITRACSRGIERDRRIARGVELAREYSWNQTASEHIKIYNHLLSD